ncbi:MAG: hypothetical protein KDJ29_20160, partial [Hyphomicrobiales bacterium]|nr:hypothetical protein [Hyphomicrobiales bacterium]
MDIAALGFRVDSKPLAKANDELREMPRAASGAERAANRMAGANDNAARAAGRMSQQTRLATIAIRQLGAAFVASLAAMAGGRFISDAIAAASDLNETISKTTTIFGSSTDAMMEWAKDSAQAMGLSKQAALEAAATMGNMFVQLGAGSDTAGLISRDMTQLAADIASFNNVAGGAEAVSNAMMSAFRGEYDSLQRYIPTINAATVQLEAMRMTGKANEKQLTALDKALATQKIIMEGAGVAAGDFARTSGQLANQQRILAANATNLAARFGEAFTPAATFVVQGLNKALLFLSDNMETIFKLSKVVGAGLLVAFAPALLASMANGLVFLGTAGVAALNAIRIAVMANPLGALAVALVTLGTLAYQFRDDIKQAIGIDVVEIMKGAANLFIGAWVGSFRAIKTVWDDFPAIMEDIAIQAGNLFYAAVEFSINNAIKAIREFYKTINPLARLADATGNSTLSNVWGTGILPEEVSFGRMKSTGAAARAGGDIASGVQDALATDWVGQLSVAFESA